VSLRFSKRAFSHAPNKKNPHAIDQGFVQYLLALTDDVTGSYHRCTSTRAALDAVATKAKSVGIDQLLMAGATLPAIDNQHL
jgi:hypothetical protein